MHLQIITPEKTVFNEEIIEILAPTDKGQIGILPHHINLISKLTHGELIIKSKNKEYVIALAGGFLEIKKGEATIIADYAEHADQIDIERAKEAQIRAENLLKNKDLDMTNEEQIRIEAELRKSLLQQHIAQTKRRQRPH